VITDALLATLYPVDTLLCSLLAATLVVAIAAGAVDAANASSDFGHQMVFFHCLGTTLLS
jgi:hypothetical protein